MEHVVPHNFASHPPSTAIAFGSRRVYGGVNLNLGNCPDFILTGFRWGFLLCFVLFEMSVSLGVKAPDSLVERTICISAELGI